MYREGLFCAEAKGLVMLLRHRGPGIESRPAQNAAGLEHVSPEAVAVLRWLSEWGVQHIVVGEVGRATRGDTNANGPVAIVPAPYARNFERLSRALAQAHARRRVLPGSAEEETAPVKLTAEMLASGGSWRLRCGDHDLDIEGRTPGVPRYQELLWEAAPFELEPGLKVQVASPVDLEHFDHKRRPPMADEIRITRAEPEPMATEPEPAASEPDGADPAT
jgi:hypothetical protein